MQPHGRAREDGPSGPDDTEGGEDAARAKAIGKPPTENLHRGIGIGEGGEHEPELDRAQTQIPARKRRGDGDVHPVDVGDEVHRAEDEKPPVTDPPRPADDRRGCLSAHSGK